MEWGGGGYEDQGGEGVGEDKRRGVVTIKVHTKKEGEGLFVACITSHPNSNYKMFSYHFL